MDIENGNTKLVLGYLWQLMRMSLLRMLQVRLCRRFVLCFRRRLAGRQYGCSCGGEVRRSIHTRQSCINCPITYSCRNKCISNTVDRRPWRRASQGL